LLREKGVDAGKSREPRSARFFRHAGKKRRPFNAASIQRPVSREPRKCNSGCDAACANSI
jgi:hypothetical protein